MFLSRVIPGVILGFLGIVPGLGAPARSASSDRAEIAVVFDDLGYATEGLARRLLEIPAPLTFAVLPGLANAQAFAESARARGHEVILHLPMEPLDLDRHDPGENALFVELDPEENRRRVRAALDSLPFYSGVSNHMGSRYTSQGECMELVLREIRDRDDDLFFLDSHTTPRSVVSEEARRLGMKCIVNDLFLDSTEEGAPRPAAQTDHLRRIALRRGRAVAIGHVRPETVAAVERAVAVWQADGIRLVGLSDLMHRGAGYGVRQAAAAKRGD